MPAATPLSGRQGARTQPNYFCGVDRVFKNAETVLPKVGLKSGEIGGRSDRAWCLGGGGGATVRGPHLQRLSRIVSSGQRQVDQVSRECAQPASSHRDSFESASHEYTREDAAHPRASLRSWARVAAHDDARAITGSLAYRYVRVASRRGASPSARVRGAAVRQCLAGSAS